MNQDTTSAGTGAGDATLLLSLDGLAVTLVERGAAGTLRVQVATADETAAACPACGVISTRVKQYVYTRPRDLPQGRTRTELVWRKRRWYCRAPWCGRKSFTESMPAVPAGARITTRLREHAGELVVDGLCATVAAAGRMSGVSWPTAMDAVRAAAERVLHEAPGPVQVLGVDEVRRGRPRWRPAEPAQPPTPAPEPVVPEPVVPEPVVPEPVTPEPLVPHRETARARTLADRWHVGFTDVGGGQGMLGQVEGRTADDVAYWLAQQTPAWRDRVRYVAIDMCTVFVAAIRRYLPHATIVVDHFRVVKLANDTVAEVRRRVGDRGLPPHDDHECGQRRLQPGRQTRRPQRLRLPQPREPTATNTLRNHPPGPRMPQPRSTSMSPGTVDGMSMGKIGRIIDAMRHERYRFSPARRRDRRRGRQERRPGGPRAALPDVLWRAAARAALAEFLFMQAIELR